MSPCHLFITTRFSDICPSTHSMTEESSTTIQLDDFACPYFSQQLVRYVMYSVLCGTLENSFSISSHICTFLSYINKTKRKYNISWLPLEAVDWGSGSGQKHVNPDLLCLWGTSEPVIVWILGTMKWVWFLNNVGNIVDKVSINVEPWIDASYWQRGSFKTSFILNLVCALLLHISIFFI